MKITVSMLVIVAALLTQFYGLAQESDEAAAQEIRRLEDELTKALLERDEHTIGRLWHDDLLFIARNGTQSTKRQRIAGLATSEQQAGETNVNDGVIVRVIGDAAFTIVDSTWTSATPSGLVPGRYRALHVWARNDGRWQLLAAQVASLPP